MKTTIESTLEMANGSEAAAASKMFSNFNTETNEAVENFEPGGQTAPPNPPLPPTAQAAGGSGSDGGDGGDDGGDGIFKPCKKSPFDLIIALACEDADFFHTSDHKTYVMIKNNGTGQVLDTNSKGFQRWLQYKYYMATGKIPNNAAMNNALKLIEAKALFEGPRGEVHIRFAFHDGEVYIDLCNKNGDQVKITKEGWGGISILESPVKFRRSEVMLPLSAPQPGGDFNWIRPLLNVEEEEDWVMLISWLVSAMFPLGPFPILILQGEQGSSKSTTTRMLRSVIDPSIIPIRSLPTSIQNLVIAAEYAWVQAYDNISHISANISDALCRMSTGGGFSTRTIYTVRDEEYFESKRPILLNGIPDLATRNDLADRSIIVYLPPLTGQTRMPEIVLWEQWNALLPYTFGLFCTAVSAALRNLENVQLPQLPRMADFTKWIVAAEEALPWERGTFMRVYEANRSRLIDTAIESDPVATSIKNFMVSLKQTSGKNIWCGSPSTLDTILPSFAPGNSARTKVWPQAPNALSDRLRRAKTSLRERGIEIKRGKSGNRFITITSTEDTARHWTS